MLDCKIPPATATQNTFGFPCWTAKKVTNTAELICQFYSMCVKLFILIQIKIEHMTFYIFFNKTFFLFFFFCLTALFSI